MYTMITTFSVDLHVKVCDESKNFLSYHQIEYNNLNTVEKLYYSKYAIKMIDKMINYMENITYFELNDDLDSIIQHNFKLEWGESDNRTKTLVSLYYETLDIANILPEKLMQYCKIDDESQISQTYTEKFDVLSSELRVRLDEIERLSKPSVNDKLNIISGKMINLVSNTLNYILICYPIVAE